MTTLAGDWHQVGDVLHPGLEADCSECHLQWSPYDDDNPTPQTEETP
jgi:hypothetical protein